VSSPVFSAIPAPGNLIPSQTAVAAAGGFGIYLDASADFEAQVTTKFETGSAVSTTAGVVASAYHVYGSTTLGAAAAAASTSITVASAAGLLPGQAIALPNELVTIGSTYTIGSTTVPVSALKYGYASAASVYLVEQTPSASVQLANPTGAAYAASTAYSKTLYLGTSRYFVYLTNLDATNAVTVEATVDLFSGVA
jgi:hypothetical protein